MADGNTTPRGGPRTHSSSVPPLALPPRKPGDLATHLGPQPVPAPLWALAKVFGVPSYYDPVLARRLE